MVLTTSSFLRWLFSQWIYNFEWLFFLKHPIQKLPSLKFEGVILYWNLESLIVFQFFSLYKFCRVPFLMSETITTINVTCKACPISYLKVLKNAEVIRLEILILYSSFNFEIRKILHLKFLVAIIREHDRKDSMQNWYYRKYYTVVYHLATAKFFTISNR